MYTSAAEALATPNYLRDWLLAQHTNRRWGMGSTTDCVVAAFLKESVAGCYWVSVGTTSGLLQTLRGRWIRRVRDEKVAVPDWAHRLIRTLLCDAYRPNRDTVISTLDAIMVAKGIPTND